MEKVKVYSKALNETISVSRIIGHIKGEQPGPTIIFTGGIHGNEPSGIFALHKVINEIRSRNTPVNGNIYAISGNLWALEKGIRFHKQDLNRLWRKEQLELLSNGNLKADNEDVTQQIEVHNTIKSILKNEKAPFYFIDLHTTSSETIPFLTVNDSILNRNFTKQFPIPIILGIEEYLSGPLLSYINELGYVAFGYEGGQHDDLSAIENHIAFIYLTLAFTGCVNKEAVNFDHYYQLLAKSSIDTREFYEIFYRYKVKPNEAFKMNPGFFNFEKIRKNQRIATSDDKPIKVKKSGRIFMPLYQGKGDDGFFTIRKIPSFLLHLSIPLRQKRLDKYLVLLPGVNWYCNKKETLIVNRKIAWLFPKQIFHLFGYRSRKADKTHFIMNNREAASRENEYELEPWNSKN